MMTRKNKKKIGKSNKRFRKTRLKRQRGGREYNKHKMPRELEEEINNVFDNRHLINTTDDIDDFERELMIQESLEEQQVMELREELQGHIPYCNEIDDTIDKMRGMLIDLTNYINGNRNRFYKMSVYLFLIYYLSMCQRPLRGGVIRKSRKVRKSRSNRQSGWGAVVCHMKTIRRRKKKRNKK